MGEDMNFEDVRQVRWSHNLYDDRVNSPAHYASGDIECIDAIEEATKDLKGLEAVCTANVMKYIWRYKHKNGVEDLKKVAWYLDKLVGRVESDHQKP